MNFTVTLVQFLTCARNIYFPPKLFETATPMSKLLPNLFIQILSNFNPKLHWSIAKRSTYLWLPMNELWFLFFFSNQRVMVQLHITRTSKLKKHHSHIQTIHERRNPLRLYWVGKQGRTIKETNIFKEWTVWLSKPLDFTYRFFSFF